MPETRITTPADMQGIKLRMPGGDAWQFLGRALGANPTRMAYAEVYTGLQTGAIDGQDNPLPNVHNMKFFEVMSQIVLSSVGYDLLTVSSDTWNAMSPEQQQAFQAAADEAMAWSAAEHLKQEEELVAFMKEQGLEIYAGCRGLPRPCAGDVSWVRAGRELAGRHARPYQRALTGRGMLASHSPPGLS